MLRCLKTRAINSSDDTGAAVQAERHYFLQICVQACANTSSWRWCNSDAGPKGNGSLELPLTLDPTCLDSYTTTKIEKEINEGCVRGMKGAVCVWKTHLFGTQGSWKWVRACSACVVLPSAEYYTWYILPPAQRERQRRAHLPCQNQHTLKRRMKRRPAFQIILVVFHTILVRPLNIFLT